MLSLEQELVWLDTIINARMIGLSEQLNNKKNNVNFELDTYAAPLLSSEDAYSSTVQTNQLSNAERLLLILSLLPHLHPTWLCEKCCVAHKHQSAFKDITAIEYNQPIHPILGLVRGKNFMGYLPSGLTFLFLVAGNQLSQRMRYMQLFTDNHIFNKLPMLGIEPHFKGDPTLSGRLLVSESFLEQLTVGIVNYDLPSIKYIELQK